MRRAEAEAAIASRAAGQPGRSARAVAKASAAPVAAAHPGQGEAQHEWASGRWWSMPHGRERRVRGVLPAMAAKVAAGEPLVGVRPVLVDRDRTARRPGPHRRAGRPGRRRGRSGCGSRAVRDAWPGLVEPTDGLVGLPLGDQDRSPRPAAGADDPRGPRRRLQRACGPGRGRPRGPGNRPGRARQRNSPGASSWSPSRIGMASLGRRASRWTIARWNDSSNRDRSDQVGEPGGGPSS